MPNGRCYMHGGPTPRGIASPNFKTGKRSKDLPTRMAARYEEARNDPDLLVLSDDIALIEARLSDVLKRVDGGESGKLWLAAGEAFRRLKVGMRANDKTVVTVALSDLDATIGAGVTDASAWSEVQTLVSQKRKLVESERRRLVEANQLITMDQAMALVAALVATVKRHVTDRDALNAISNDLARLTTHGDEPGPRARR